MANQKGDLTGKVVLVTGSSSGIGEAIAVILAGRRASVTLTGRNEERLEAVKQRCIKANGGDASKVLVVAGDANLKSTRESYIDQTVARFGRLDILVPNAGGSVAKSTIQEASEEDFDMMINTNLKSTFFLIQYALPHLEKSKGNIVCVSSSVSQFVFGGGNITYPIAKAGVDHLVKSLSVELGPKGIRVNSIGPSYVETRVFRAIPEETRDAFMERWAQNEKTNQPFESRLGTPEEMAEAVAFLASDQASFITGQCLLVDGGRNFMGPTLPM